MKCVFVRLEERRNGEVSKNISDFHRPAMKPPHSYSLILKWSSLKRKKDINNVAFY